MNKNQFRKDMLKLRNDLSKHYTDLASEEISDKFLTSALYNRAINIFIFVSYNKEVNTHKIIKKALEDGKNIFIPVVDRQTMTMSISKLKDFNKLEENYMGIL